MSSINRLSNSGEERSSDEAKKDHYKRYSYRGLGKRWFSWVKDLQILCGDIHLPNSIREYFDFGSDIFDQQPSYHYEVSVKANRESGD